MSANTPAKGIVAYLLLAFGLAWGAWAILMPMAANPTQLQLYLLPGAMAPAVATFIVRKWITREGFADAGLGLHVSKWRYYLIAWLLPFPVLGFIVLAAGPLGLGHPDLSMTHAVALAAPTKAIPTALRGVLGYVIPLQLAITALLVTPLLFGEEFGWRGYLQIRVFPGRPTLAAVATGIVWGLWHLPVIFRGYEYPGNNIAIATAAFCCATVLLSIIFGWLRRRSGSVWVTSLAHAATNAIGGSLSVLLFPPPANPLFVGYLGVLSWIPLGLLAVWIVARTPSTPGA